MPKDDEFRYIVDDAHAVLNAYDSGGVPHAADVAATIKWPAMSLVMMCAFASDLHDKVLELQEQSTGSSPGVDNDSGDQ